MVQGLYVPADPAAPVERREYRQLEDYQAAVSGWIEVVDIPPLNITLYVNENGLAERLPFNGRATFLWWYQMAHVRKQAALVGDVAIVGYPNIDGDSTDVPEDVMDLLTEQVPHVVSMKVGGEWFRNRTVNRDYWEAIYWAMIKLSREDEIEDVGVVRLDQADRLPLRPIPPIPSIGTN